MLFAPPDVDAAYDAWGANCGPCSLAAVLGVSVEAVRPFMDSGWERRRYTNLMHMYAALRNAGAKVSPTPGTEFPAHGLAFIQWKGPWDSHVLRAYQHTHWLGIDGEMVYDLNADASWVKRDLWKKAMPVLIRDEMKGATGDWYVRKGIEVHR